MSFARVHLGMSREEFLDCTPRYFDDLVKQHRARQQHGELMLAQLCAISVNFSYRGPKKPVHPKDFLLTKEPKKKRSQQRIRQEIAGVFERMGGWEIKE